MIDDYRDRMAKSVENKKYEMAEKEMMRARYQQIENDLIQRKLTPYEQQQSYNKNSLV